jgi:hypothetical protein
MVEELGPVLAAGWRGDPQAPLLHAKLLVLGDVIGYEDDEFDLGGALQLQAEESVARIGQLDQGCEQSFAAWQGSPGGERLPGVAGVPPPEPRKRQLRVGVQAATVSRSPRPFNSAGATMSSRYMEASIRSFAFCCPRATRAARRP